MIRKSVLTAPLACLVGILCALTPTTSRADDERRAAERPHEREIHQTYSVLSSLTAADRRVYYRRLTNTAKAGLWTFQLQNYLNAHGNLTQEQRAVIREAITRLPQLFARERGADIDIADLEARARIAFPDDVTTIFFTLGGPSIDPAFSALRHEIRAQFFDDGGPIERPECDCATQSSACHYTESCMAGGCTLDSSWPACGFMWWYTCDGICKNNIW